MPVFLKSDQTLDIISAMSTKEKSEMREIVSCREMDKWGTNDEQSSPNAASDSVGRELNDENIRNSICTWMFKVVDFYNFDRETIYIGMSYLERYIIRFPCPSKKNCQLVAIASLYIAVKVHDTNRTNTLDVFVQLAGGKFTAEDIKEKETSILEGLQWRYLNPVTPQACAYHILTLLNDNGLNSTMQVVHEVANYVIEVMLLSGPSLDSLRSRSCTIAYASVIVALEGVRDDAVSAADLTSFYGRMRRLDIVSDGELKWMVQLIKSTLSNPSKGSHLDLNEIRLSLDGNRKIYHYAQSRNL